MLLTMNVLIVIYLVFMLGLAVVVWWRLFSMLDLLLGHPLRDRLTAHWPVTEGTAENFEAGPRSIGRRTILTVYYSYRVDDWLYSGSFARLYDSYDSAYFAGLRWKERRISIRYKPGRPSVSFFSERSWRLGSASTA